MINQMVRELRRDWAISDQKRDEGLSAPSDITRVDDISYGPYGKENLLDIYYPNKPRAEKETGKFPVIVSIHGGAWVYGGKELYQYYCMNLAQRGFCVVNFNYRLAPESKYPAALEDINRVFTFIMAEGSQYPMDIDNIFVVGDSAGAQLACQYITILTNPAYAGLFDFQVPLLKLKAAGLNCGFFDVQRCREFHLYEYLEEYTGELNDEKRHSLDVPGFITAAFPPTYLASSANDYLQVNTPFLHELLQSLGVECQMKIYGTKEQEEMGHVFHVNIKLPGATACNDDECEFFNAHCDFD